MMEITRQISSFSIEIIDIQIMFAYICRFKSTKTKFVT